MDTPEKTPGLVPSITATDLEKKEIDSIFNKARTGTKTTPVRSFAFDTLRQRNAQMLQKGLTKPGTMSYDVLRRTVNSVHIARICVNVLKEKITKTKWSIQNIDPLVKTDDKRIKEVEELFKHPNQNDETFRTLLDKMLEDLLVLDAVTLEKTRYPDGTLAELHFVDSATIRPVFDEKGNQDMKIPLLTEEGEEVLPVSYIQVLENSQYGGPQSGQIVAAWPKKDVVHFHQHPQGSMEMFGYGLSPLEGVLSVVANLLNADNFNGTYFEEGAFPPVILMLKSQTTQENLEAYREYMYSELMGNFHRPAIMAGQDGAEVLNLKDLSNRDMQFMEYTQFLARLLCAAYGLSGQDIGLTEEVGSKNVSETQKQLSEAKGYGSVLHLLKEVFNQEIIWKDFGYTDLEFDWVVEDTTDPQVRSTISDTQLKNGTKTLNEVRKLQGDEPFPEWADVPMIWTSGGYKPVIASPEEGTDEETPGDKKQDSELVDKPGNEDPYKDQFKKSVYTLDGYVTQMDDRGYGQPFIYYNAITEYGWVIKPPVAVNVTSQELEKKLTQQLSLRGLNVKLVTEVPYVELCLSFPTEMVKEEFQSYVNMTPEYDSEKWKSKFGRSRLFPSYLVCEYISGFPLNNPILIQDMKRDPKSYAQAAKDLANLWKAEKELVLGDRRADQYIITSNKRAWGFDYQFEGDVKRWEETSNSIQRVLVQIPYLNNIFLKEIGQEEGILGKIRKAVRPKN